MSKVVVFLFVVIALGYVFVLNSLKGNDSSSLVNREFRPLLLRSVLTRQIFFLNKPGDARYEYVSRDNNKIVVEVDYQKDVNPNEEIKDWFEALFIEVLNKEAEVVISEDNTIENLDSFSDNQLKKYEKVSRSPTLSENRTYLHILYVAASKETPSNTGLVLDEDSIFIFGNSIRELSERNSILARIEQSTLNHEFGHLLGLEHVDRDDCVMSETVEVYGNRRRQSENIPLDYCKESWERVREIRSESE